MYLLLIIVYVFSAYIIPKLCNPLAKLISFPSFFSPRQSAIDFYVQNVPAPNSLRSDQF